MNSKFDYHNNCMLENPHDDCFNVLTPQEKSLLENNSIKMSYDRDEQIIKQGSFASHVVFLQSGLIKAYMEGNAKDLIIKIIPENHFVGLSSFYDGNHQFIYSASAYIPSSALLIEMQTFRKILEHNPLFALRILNVQNENTAQVYGRFYCLTRKQSCGLIADLLMCLSLRVFKSSQFYLPISRSDFADLTGLSVESVMRILKDFKQEGLISLKGKNMEILQSDALQKISQYG